VSEREWDENEAVRDHLVQAEWLLRLSADNTNAARERITRAIQLIDRQSLSETVRPGAT